MPQERNWYRAYTELTGFIAEHPSVKIAGHVISIPEDVRPNFYRLFDAVRIAFVKDKFPNLLKEAEALSESYTKAEREVTESIGIGNVSMELGLQIFLRNPIDGVMKVLFWLLFDLLKNREDIETLEQKASDSVETAFKRFINLGYGKWVALSLAEMLKPDKIFCVTLHQPTDREITNRSDKSRYPVPPPEESKHLSFEYHGSPILTVPDFIVHSTRTNNYIAMRTQFEDSMWIASCRSSQREWYPLRSPMVLQPSSVLIFVSDEPQDISLIADAKKICRPDLVIETQGQQDWAEEDSLEQAKLNNAALKPKLGTYIVARGPVLKQVYGEIKAERVLQESYVEQELAPSQESEKREEAIYVLTAGFDQSKLVPIIDALIECVRTSNDK